MNRTTSRRLGWLGGSLLALSLSGCALFWSDDKAPAKPYDEAAARSLAHKDSCLRCHGVHRDKRGPSYAHIAADYRARPDAEAALYHHLTSGDTRAMPDGHMETHRVIHSQDPQQVRNLVRWILDQ